MQIELEGLSLDDAKEFLREKSNLVNIHFVSKNVHDFLIRN